MYICIVFLYIESSRNGGPIARKFLRDIGFRVASPRGTRSWGK
jgi:hypothetical protein